MWFSFALCIGFYTVLFLVFKHSLLTRYHFLLGMDLLCMLGMYVLHWGSYTEVTLGDYSAQIFFTFLELLFQLAVISDLILLWLYEFSRYRELTLVNKATSCCNIFVRPSFSVYFVAIVRAILSAGLLAVAVMYAAEETKNQDFISLIYVIVHIVAFVCYGVIPMVLFNLMMSSYAYHRKPRKSARRVLRDISFSYLYVPFFALLYFFAIVLYLVIARQTLGKRKMTSGVVSIQMDTHELMKIPIFAIVVLVLFAFRIRDYQELTELRMFSDYDDAAELSRWSQADDHGVVTKSSRDNYKNYPVVDPEAHTNQDDDYTYDEDTVTDTTADDSATETTADDEDEDDDSATETTADDEDSS